MANLYSAGDVIAYGAPGGMINLAGSGGALFIGRAGAETISAAGSTGESSVYVGSGSDFVFFSNSVGDRFTSGSGSATVVAPTSPLVEAF